MLETIIPYSNPRGHLRVYKRMLFAPSLLQLTRHPSLAGGDVEPFINYIPTIYWHSPQCNSLNSFFPLQWCCPPLASSKLDHLRMACAKQVRPQSLWSHLSRHESNAIDVFTFRRLQLCGCSMLWGRRIHIRDCGSTPCAPGYPGV